VNDDVTTESPETAGGTVDETSEPGDATAEAGEPTSAGSVGSTAASPESGDQSGVESGADADEQADLDDDQEGVPGDEREPGSRRQSRIQLLEQEGDIAADYLEELLDIADLDGDLDMDVEGDRAAVSIVGADLTQLVGTSGEVLEALQELTRLAVYRETGERSRLMLDISGYRAQKRTELEELAADTVSKVKESGEPVSLRPMSPFERKVVHDAVADAGCRSVSEGVEPRRYVVVLPG
jgi:spoIIIJ-associated protein